MNKNQDSHHNELAIYRRRLRFSRKRVARLLGHSSTAMLSRYENGRSHPPLLTVLKLEIIYRTPVAFLYQERYASLRQEIREMEDRHPSPNQPALF